MRNPKTDSDNLTVNRKLKPKPERLQLLASFLTFASNTTVMNNEASNMNANSRREFVKKSSLIAGSLIAAPFLSRSNYFSGADDSIKLALIGCGGRGTGAAKQALLSNPKVQLVAMADAFRDNLDNSYKSLTMESPNAQGQNVKSRVVVPEENKFTGFDAYLKAIRLQMW
jgi:hypothetical protein